MDPTRRRMKPGLQRVKRKAPVQLDDQFAIDDESLERNFEQRRHNLGKAAEKAPDFPLLDRATLLEREAAKAVPFRLELPLARLIGKRFRGSRLHWRGAAARMIDRGARSGPFRAIIRSLCSQPRCMLLRSLCRRPAMLLNKRRRPWFQGVSRLPGA